MTNTPRFLSATDVSEILGVSVASAYRLVKILNEELKKKDKITIPGKISKRYFEEKTYV
ncbi:MAG: transcriptional regulator [Fusobacteriaceae bacterium]